MKSYKLNQQKEEICRISLGGSPKQSFCILRMCHPSHTWMSVINQGSSPTQCSEFLLGPCYVDMIDWIIGLCDWTQSSASLYFPEVCLRSVWDHVTQSHNLLTTQYLGFPVLPVPILKLSRAPLWVTWLVSIQCDWKGPTWIAEILRSFEKFWRFGSFPIKNQR